MLDHIDHDLVAHKPALIHNFLSVPTKWCLFGDLLPEHVSCSLAAVNASLGTTCYDAEEVQNAQDGRRSISPLSWVPVYLCLEGS